MRRVLVLGLTAAVLFLGVPRPSSAAPVTRSAPYDYGLQCLTRNASAGTSVGGDGLPYGCTPVPDPVAQSGYLSTGQVGVSAATGLWAGGMSVVGAVGNATVGRMWSAAGLNVNSGPGGQLKASAEATGHVCLTVAYGGGSFVVAESCGASPSVSVSVPPNQNYAVQVTLRDRPSTVLPATPAPCPPSLVATCTFGVAVSASSHQAMVGSITYSIG